MEIITLTPETVLDYGFCGYKDARKHVEMIRKAECIEDARNQGLGGVAVVSRKGSFMAKKEIFLRNGFSVVGSHKPDFELLSHHPISNTRFVNIMKSRMA